MDRRFRIFLLFMSGVIAITFGCRGKSRPSSLAGSDSFNILIVTLDTTRADRLGCYGYAHALTPNLDRLAAEGVRFSHAYSPVPLTLPAHCSLFTGLYPLFHRVRDNGNYFLAPQNETLAEILTGAGYTTAAFIASFVLDSRFGLDQGFGVYDDDLDSEGHIKTLMSERRADAVVDCFSRWFSARPQAPFLVWVHFYDPHFPYDPPEPFRSTVHLLPYDGEIAYVDLHLGRILALLARQNTLDRTLIVVAGDHGEGFDEHGETGHGVFCYGETINIPLILWAPRRIPAGLVCDHPASLLDIVPTVLEFLKMPRLARIQGMPLQKLLKKPKPNDRPLFLESVFPKGSFSAAPVRGVIQGGFKYLDLPRPEFYDLSADPEEKKNLFREPSSSIQAMRQCLLDFDKAAGASKFTAERTMNAEERERLESLGYLSSQPLTSTSDKGLPDPKDVICAWSLFQRGELNLKAHRLIDAESDFKAAISESPRLINAYSGLAEVYYQRGDVTALDEILAQGVAANPGNGTLYLRRLFYLFQFGRVQAVLEGLDKALDIVPYWQKEQLYNLAGTAFGRAGKYEQAAGYFSRVLVVEPGNAKAAKDLGYALWMCGRYAEALEYQRRAEKKLPLDAQLAGETAMTLAKLGDYTAAEQYFEKSLRLKPEEETVLRYAEMLDESGHHARALSLLSRYADGPMFSRSFREKARQRINSRPGR
jgi:arylsulfatase A-like enzyme/Tfp pilus assembly protein PilF